MRRDALQRVQSSLHILTQDDKKYVRKIATPSGEFDVLEQIKLLQMLPHDIALHYPALLEFSINSRPYYYTMPYYDFPTFRDLVLYSDLDPSTLLKFAKPVFTFLFEIQHCWRKTKAEADYARKAYIERVQNRLARIANTNTMLREVLFSKRLFVSNEELQGVQLLLEKLERALNRYKLFGFTLCSTHGQMEFAHILINIQDAQGKDFILLDAKGASEMFDPAYDVGKFWQCSSGLFDWIEEKQFEIAPIQVTNGETHIDYLRFNLKERQDTCRSFHQIFREYIIDTYHFSNHDQVVLEYQIAAATHLLGSVDFFFDMSGPISAVACYIQGVRLLTAAIDLL